MIKISKEDFKTILALEDARQKVFSIEQQLTEVVTLLRSTPYEKDCSDVDQLRVINFYLRDTRRRIGKVTEKITLLNQ
ncbi:MAG: hypothetical protein KH225_04020 [Proteobacteria bacterium]|nr:hypothetical protein [Pseudomonadota bacterium]